MTIAVNKKFKIMKNVNVEEMKLNANGEELTIEEKLFGRKIDDDEIVQVRYGDLKKALRAYIEKR
jgi:hypothetical protein